MTTSFAILLALVALAAGGLIGWLLGSRGGEQGEGDRQGAAASARRGARGARRHALGNGAAELRACAVEGGIRAFRPAHGGPRRKPRFADQAVPRDRRPVARKGPQGFPRQGRRALHRGRQGERDQAQGIAGAGRDDAQALRRGAAAGREGARRPICRAARGGRAGPHRAGAGARRNPQSRQCPSRSPKARGRWGEQSLQERARAGGPQSTMPISRPKCRSMARRAGSGPT